MIDLIASLEAELGAGKVSAAQTDLLAYAHDTFPLALKQAESEVQPFLPDVVVFPRTTEDVSKVLRIANINHAPVHIYGGGSGIVGGALAVNGGIMIETKGLAGIAELDPISNLVTVGAGMNGQRLEDFLNGRGYILGHYPQSLRSSTVGGWIAHRATGTASTLYGGIEEIVAGMEVVLASGKVLKLRVTPRSATGPELRELFIGSEGTLGVVTQATLRIHPLPEERRWLAFTFPTLESGLDAIRRTVQSDLRPAIVRLYDEIEAAHLLEAASLPAGACLLFYGCQGDREQVAYETGRVRNRSVAAGGTVISPSPAESWWEDRFFTRGFLQTLRTKNGVADALEVSGTWKVLPGLYRAMRMSMEAALGIPEREGLVYGHCSHVYPDGGNLYMIFHGFADRGEDLPELYNRVLKAAFQACVLAGGSISHHHGIGLAKARWMELELGSTGVEVLQALQHALDPDGLLNPGKLGAAPYAG